MTHSICCANCLAVVPHAMPGQKFCPPCAAERERIRRLKWKYKRKDSPARAKRTRAKKVKVTDESVRDMLANIPADTRDVTGRLMGDPLPTRSALDRRQA